MAKDFKRRKTKPEKPTIFPMNSEKDKLFNSVKEVYPAVPNSRLNFLLKGLALDLNLSIGKVVEVCNSVNELFLVYYKNRDIIQRPYYSRFFYKLYEKYLIKLAQLKTRKKCLIRKESIKPS